MSAVRRRCWRRCSRVRYGKTDQPRAGKRGAVAQTWTFRAWLSEPAQAAGWVGASLLAGVLAAGEAAGGVA
jgi:hypothetical protein